MFRGTYTAIVTPFKDGKVDEPSFERLIKAQIKGGVNGIVPVGTTGESPTLSFEEHIAVVERSVELADGKVQVMLYDVSGKLVYRSGLQNILKGTNTLRIATGSNLTTGIYTIMIINVDGKMTKTIKLVKQ